MTPQERLADHAHHLAMLVLQSELYRTDPDTREQVDAVLALTRPRKVQS